MHQETPTPGYDEARWMRALENIAMSLGKDGPPVQLCLIGSAVCIFSGMAARSSRDLDIWEPSSAYDLLELKAATENAGLLFNPKNLLEPELPYLQLVKPGIVQMGKFVPIQLFQMGRLVVSHPPIENIIAAKLSRADAKDLEDIQFLVKHYQPDRAAIKRTIASFAQPARNAAKENLIYLEIFQ